jgi:alcohol dehydrogenase (cytochrome c)
MKARKLTLAFLLALSPALLQGQGAGGLDPASLRKPLADTWPTYSGDYTGRRYSALKQVDRNTVKNLTLAWVSRVNAGTGDAITGGVGAGEFTGTPQVKGAILQVDDVLYVTAPDHVWAVDARDGHTLWHYFWRTRGGTHIGNRGVGLWRNYLFFETPDNFLVKLDARTNGTSRSRTSTNSIFRRWRRSSSTITSSWGRATTSTPPDSCSRTTPKPESWNGSSTPCR